MTTTAIDKTQIIKPKTRFKKNQNLIFGRIQNLKGIQELIDTIGELKKNGQ